MRRCGCEPNKCKEEQEITNRPIWRQESKGICVCGCNFLSRRDIWRDTRVELTICTLKQHQALCSGWRHRKGLEWNIFSLHLFPIWHTMKERSNGRDTFIDNNWCTRNHNMRFLKTQSMLSFIFKAQSFTLPKVWVAYETSCCCFDWTQW